MLRTPMSTLARSTLAAFHTISPTGVAGRRSTNLSRIAQRAGKPTVSLHLYRERWKLPGAVPQPRVASAITVSIPNLDYRSVTGFLVSTLAANLAMGPAAAISRWSRANIVHWMSGKPRGWQIPALPASQTGDLALGL